MTNILGLHRTGSRISVSTIASFAENINTSEAYKQFCRTLHQIGVTEDAILQKEKEILEIFKPQSMVASSQIGGSNIGNQGRAGCSNAETSLHTSSH